MKINEKYTIPADRETVWALFENHEFLQQCIPGCEKLDPIGDDTFAATLKIGVAAIKGTYEGTVKMENKRPPSDFRLVINGKSKIGFVSGFSDFSLEEIDPNQTEITLDGDLTVGGKIARVGQRIIGGAAKMMIGKFFKNVTKIAKSI